MQNTTCQNCKKEFEITSEDLGFYEKMKVPAPTFCPLCRAQRRFAFRNERKLFRVKNAFTGKDIFSLFPPESGRKIISQEEWHGDGWDAMEYGREYDFSRSFFEQFRELMNDVPVYNLNVKLMQNSPYCGNATALKNSYLVFNSNNSENCMYGNANDDCRDCIDNAHIKHSERSYESFWLENCYQCYFSIMCVESRNLWFSRDCLGCSDCFGCANLRKASYCIFNQQYTREEYFKELEKMRLDTASGVEVARQKARAFWQTQPTKYHQGLKNVNSSGSYVAHSKNVNDSYLVRESENMRYCQYMQVPGNKDCYDSCFWGEHMELLYESSVCGENSYNLKFCVNCWPMCRDSEYSFDLFSSSDCFGCVGLKKKQYCILNKQYSKEEYSEMVEKIKKQMDEMPYRDKQGLIYKYGELFPIEFSSFGYNNTVAIQHFPLTKEEAINKGYPWIDVEKGEYVITKKAAELSDAIGDVADEILKEVVECEGCKGAYRILENELIFLKNEKIPLPRMCNDCRHARRINDRLKLFLYERSCMCAGENDKTTRYKNTVKHEHKESVCGEIFKTGYSSDSPEIVYCEKCYQQEVY
jgi:hypothetical protein